MSNDPSAGDAWQRWFKSVWAEREDNVYRGLFTDLGGGVFRATPAHFARLRQRPVHPGWLHHGVFCCPPQQGSAHYTYVTSGLSNPWNLDQPGRDPSGHSGLGFELCLCAPERAEWPIAVLHHLMAWQLLVAVGATAGQPLQPGQRVPLGGPIDGRSQCALTWLLVEAPAHFAPSFELPSGTVDWLVMVGVSTPEVEFARQKDQKALVERLQQGGVWPLTDPGRPSLEGVGPR